jgi:uncharacterized Zn-finger protein
MALHVGADGGLPADAVNMPPVKRRRRASVDDSAAFVCTVEGCGMSFRKKFQLKSHTVTHTGVKPFACTVVDCGKSFMTAARLAAHTKLHGNQGDVCVDVCL